MSTLSSRKSVKRRHRPPILALALALAAASLPTLSSAQSAPQPGLTADALFDALDLDGDGVLHKRDVREGLERVGLALGFEPEAVLMAAASDGAGAGGAGGGGAGGVGAAGAGGGRAAKDLGGAPPNHSSSGSQGKKLLNTAALRKSLGSDREQLGFWKAFTSSVAMIIATEIGDKTFFIAAVLSMRNARSAVFGGAILALIIMTILSTMMGLVLPSFLPRRYTHIIGGLLFLYFGIRLIVESRGMKEGEVSDELEEVEEELRVGSGDKKVDADIESSGGAPASGNSSSGTGFKKQESGMSSASSYSSRSWEKVFLQSLTLTFLAEWGDRSQIATIALAAAKDPYGVTLGGCLGHSMCTGMAVVGGRMLASRISEKTVTFWGGTVFLGFGVHSLFFEA